MKITKITASYGRTFNLGNYENVRIESGILEAVLEDGDDLHQAFEELRQEARQQVAEEYARLEAGRE